ncbi:MAG: glycosyltransferase [Thermoproteota archaeon]|nr:glycosyltransferase [Thermoproteota archaeon]
MLEVHSSPVLWTATSILFLSSLLVLVLLISLTPLGLDSLGMVKILKGIAAAVSDNLGSAIIKLEEHFWFYIPLGIIGIWRWLVWGVKKTGAALYRPISEGAFISRVSIITPVYNENPETFKLALQSWVRNKPDEIIAVIDERDKDCIDVFQNYCKSKNGTHAKLIVTQKPGKRQALADGILEAKGEIVALVDSDTIWDNNIKQKLLQPFSDPVIGGVTPRNHPVKRQSIWEKMTDVFWDMRNYYDLPSQTAMGSALTCLTGRTSLYRRELLLPKLDVLLNEVLLGKRKESGEDKCLTRLVQKDGWKTYYQSNAVIYSAAAHDFKTFITQRLRWTRNSHNSDLVSLLDGWAWRHPFLAFYMIDRFISTFTLFLGPIFLGVSIYYHQFTITLAILALWMVGRGIKILPHLRRRPDDILLVPVFVAVNFLMAAVKLYGLVTLREQKWIREHYHLEKSTGYTHTLVAKIKDITLTTAIVFCLVFFVFYAFK